MQRLTSELGWNRSDVSLAGAVSLLAMAIAIPVAGRMADRHGAPRVLAVGCGALIIALVSLATVTSYWQFLIGYALFGGVGYGLASLPVAGALVAKQVTGRQGLAMGVATSGTTAGQLVIIPVLAWMFDAVGWRLSFGGLALLAALVGVFALSLRVPPTAERKASLPGIKVGDLLKNRTFHGLFWSFLFCGFTSTGIVETHLIPFAEVCGFTPVASSLAYSVFALFNLFGMLGSGYLSDRIDRRTLLVTIYIIRSVAFIIPFFVGTNYVLLLGFSIFVGMAFYATFPPTIGLSAANFGKQNIGLVVGLLTVGHSIGAAAGAFSGGYIYDLFMKYDWVWILSLALAGSSAVLALLALDPRSKNPIVLQSAATSAP